MYLYLFNTWIASLVLILKLSSSRCATLNPLRSNEWLTEPPSSTPVLQTAAQVHRLPKSSIKMNNAPIASTKITYANVEAFIRFQSSFSSKVSCVACTLAIGAFQKSIRNSEDTTVIRKVFINLCIFSTVHTKNVCTGIFDAFAPELLPALKKTTLNPKQVCYLILGETCEKTSMPSEHEWRITLPTPKKKEIVEKPFEFDEKNPTLKVLQISDTHYDDLYHVGSIANCDEPLCCRKGSKSDKNNGNRLLAGKWGSYKCDSPEILIKDLLNNVRQQHPDIDYIIWTGDIPPHDIWSQSKTKHQQLIQNSVKHMFDAFEGIPIFPALGNHEGIPTGNFPPPNIDDKDHSISWLYDFANTEWRKLMLPESTSSTVRYGGFYSILVRPKLRLIALNTNYCHNLSWWLIVNSTDPAQELEWLVNQLQFAEDNDEKVHIIGHIAPGSTDCLKVWSENYYAIVNRYKDVIKAQFFGHSHADEFEVFYDTDSYSRATNVAYLGPSVAPYNYQNPAYRIYYIDGEHQHTTWEVIDHETWTMDLEQANKNTQRAPIWFKLYSAKNSFNMKSLRPSEWDNLLQRMVSDDILFKKFYSFYYRRTSNLPAYSNKQKFGILCDLKSGKSQDRQHLCSRLGN